MLPTPPPAPPLAAGAPTSHDAPAVVRAQGGRLVGPDGIPLLLRGVGLGNWLLPEGYMWGFGDSTASPRQIEALVADLLGQDAAARFWTQFRDRFITVDDIAAIAAAGFDHVRLPMNWRVLMTPDGAVREDGFALVDRLVGWCREAGLLVLLDLHGAPGGQTGTNIDDSLGRPELFMSERNLDLTVALWVEIARRYRDEPAVLGYDLLNEPLPNEWQHVYAAELVVLYRRLTAAIRAVDPNHLIMYEGTHWATNWEIFTEIWDANSALQFHRYWMPTDRRAIGQFLDVGRALGLPVYMGEGGENTPTWVAAAHQLYEDFGVGWNFWTWKKVETLTSPVSITAPKGWDRVVAYAAGTGTRPARAVAQRIFDELVENTGFAACAVRPEIVAAMFRRAPVTLPAHAFTHHGPGVSYATSAATPHPGLRPDDAVTLRCRDGRAGLDFTYPEQPDPGAAVVADLRDGDWLAYEVELGEGAWRFVVECEPGGTGRPVVRVDGTEVRLDPGPDGPGTQGWSGAHRCAGTRRGAIRVGAAGGVVTLVGLRVTAAEG